MRRIVLGLGVLGVLLAMGMTWATRQEGGDESREAAWKEVQQAIQQGLPRTAIEKLEPIIKQSTEEKAYAEATKAIALRISLEGNIEGNKPEEKIRRLEAEIEKAPAEMRPLLETIEANWFWNYYQQNSWRFVQRTQTAAAPSDDFTTWSLPRIFEEIDKHFQTALAQEEFLKQSPIGDWDAVLVKGTAPDTYRPTLYDFIGHDALQFYAAGEQAGSRRVDAFALRADSPIFAKLEEFLAWEVESPDESAPLFRAVRLYQQLLRFHLEDQDPAARIDADLGRLEFASNHAVGAERTARYQAALERFVAANGDSPIVTRAFHAWARSVHGENDFVKAREIAQRGATRFPDSVGAAGCRNLIKQIEARDFNVQIERVWNEPKPSIQVNYRNLTKLYFRIVPLDFDAHIRQGAYHPESLNNEQRQALLRRRPLRAWTLDLPATDDYQQRSKQTPAPLDLASGAYYLLASGDPEFSEAENVIQFSHFWVSRLALVMRTRQGEGELEGILVEAASGLPIADAQVSAWTRDNRNQRRGPFKTRTDAKGMFRFEADRQRYLVLVEHDGDRLATDNEFWVQRYNRGHPSPEHSIFFTDRAIYRPGQTISFKGLCLHVEQGDNSYRTISGRNVTVVLRDSNGKEVATQNHRTNDYGSFAGSFTAPNDRVLGQYSLALTGGPPGVTSFRIEEYKRPKFRVELESSAEPARLGEAVTVPGKATAYTGAAIDGAEVSYRVVREVRYPYWYSWRYWWRPQQNQSQEITSGVTTTDVDGSFSIEFQALPDESIARDAEPTFQFSVYADVTDRTGETRTDMRSIRLGYKSIQARLTADDWQVVDTPVEINVQTTTLDGEGAEAEGELKIYRLEAPEKVQRPRLPSFRPVWRRGGVETQPEPDLSDPNTWPLGEVVWEQSVRTDGAGNAKVEANLETGLYRAIFTTRDSGGQEVRAEQPIRVLDPSADKLALKIPHLFSAKSWTVEPGESWSAVWGTGYAEGRAYVEIEHRGKLLKSYWTSADATQVRIEQEVDESLRGGFNVRVTFVHENRAYLEQRRVEVPWSNKQLALSWEHFVSKLKPGQEETWTLVIKAADAKDEEAVERMAAELVATLYDASLDAFVKLNWPALQSYFYRDYSPVSQQFENQARSLNYLRGNWGLSYEGATLTYRRFPAEIIQAIQTRTAIARGGGFGGGGPSGGLPAASRAAADGAMMELEKAAAPGDKFFAQSNRRMAAGEASDAGGQRQPDIDLSQVTARKNLQETAFFYPQLRAGEDGSVRLEFTMPEALTEWRFLGFAHDRQLRGGLIEDTVVTSKELMIQPNPPRFLREGDEIEFTVKVSNQSPTRQSGTVRLTFADAHTDSNVDVALENTDADRSFEIPAGQSQTVSWRIHVPDDMGFLTYKAIGSTGRLSDGEEGYLPVLSRRILVTESLPLPIRGPETKKFDFERLRNSAGSDTLENKTLTVQVVSQPAWYAVLALPYLMEYPYECTEQTFNRLYANALARHLANSDPKIRRIFEQWKNTPALDSPLEKNEELKSVLLEETPWVRQAESESQTRRNIGILFDQNRLNSELARALNKLQEAQHEDGGWPWFPGGRKNEYMTLYITTGFGRLRHLGVDIDVSAAVKSLRGLDAWVDRMYQRILEGGKSEENHLSSTVALYLYGRSFFLQDQPIDAAHRPAVDYFLDQARKYWLKLGIRQSQGHLAIALKRFGDLETARGIMRSIKERAKQDEELGMYWRDLELSWWWYRAPIETQALMIEAFDEVMGDEEAVAECQVWLLKQKQTQDWKTTKATADACYSLLLRGSNLLSSDALVEITLGDLKIEPANIEPGTGFYEKRFVGEEIKPAYGDITLTKTDKGVAWGSVNWQYLEDMSKVTPYEGTPLTLKKRVFTKQNSPEGPTLVAVDGPVEVGDELVVRVELRVDRDMEYVHMKDYRGSGVEPVDVLSQYRYQDGLAYYQMTRDTATHFFIDYLPKGTYVFEYSVRVQLRGEYQTGMAEIQSMYAPEFNSHSESIELKVE